MPTRAHLWANLRTSRKVTTQGKVQFKGRNDFKRREQEGLWKRYWIRPDILGVEAARILLGHQKQTYACSSRPPFCASLRHRNAHGPPKKSIVRQNLPGPKMETHSSHEPAQLKCTQTCHKNQFTREFMPARPKIGSMSQEPVHARIYRKKGRGQDRDAQFVRACAVDKRTVHKHHSTRAFKGKMPAPKIKKKSRGKLSCEAAQSKFTPDISEESENLQENPRGQMEHPDLTPA